MSTCRGCHRDFEYGYPYEFRPVPMERCVHCGEHGLCLDCVASHDRAAQQAAWLELDWHDYRKYCCNYWPGRYCLHDGLCPAVRG